MKELPQSLNPKYLKPYTLKPTPIPEGLIVTIDTREQRPLFTRPPKGLIMVRDTLSDGDYSIRGLEHKICFERKSSDIFTYCATDHKATKVKMSRFKTIIQSGGFVGLIIEKRESDLYQFQQHTRVHPESIRGALTAFTVDYGIHIYYGTRDTCARWMLDCMARFYNKYKEV
jgi:ERCC4-type nuclease